jgi:hypothetical protein
MTQSQTGNHITVTYHNLYKKSQEEIIIEINKRLSDLESKYDNLLTTNNQLEQNNRDLLTRINTLESSGNLTNNGNSGRLFSDILKVNNSQQISEPLSNVINFISDHEKEIKKREKNLIIFGLSSNNNDHAVEQVNKLLNKMMVNPNRVNKILRLDRNNSNNSMVPIKIIVHDIIDKFAILNNGKNLQKINSDDNTRININLDQTELERIRFKKLNLERIDKNKENERINSENGTTSSFYYGIRNNIIKKISIQSS